MKRILPLLILFASFIFSNKVLSQGTNCGNASPFCTGVTSFPSPTNTSAQSGPYYGCLGSTPNPAWFYFQVSQSGNIVFTIEQNDNGGNGIDVDFILWGPFASPTGNCNNLTSSNDVDCSFAPDPIETVTVPNAQAGEYYILLITNYDGAAGNVTFTQTGGTGATDCALLCPAPDLAMLNGSGNVVPLPANISCSDAPITLFANQSHLPIGQVTTPCYKFIVNPTNAEAPSYYSAEFSEDGFTLGCFGPNGGNANCASPIGNVPSNTNWTVYVSYVSPTASQEQIRLCETSNTGSDLTYEVRDCASNALITSGTWATNAACSNVTFSPSSLSGISYFSGPGVTTTDWGAGEFDPAVAGPGTHTLVYHWNDENGCDRTDTALITVTSPNNPAWSPPANLCTSSSTVDLDNSVTGTAGGTWSGGAYIAANGVFDPVAAGVGTHSVTYTVGSGTCQSTSTQSITVSSGGNSAWSAPPDMCETAANVNLDPLVTGNPGGTWSGTGVAGNVFNPSTAGAGTHTITYSVGSGACISTTNHDVIVSAADVADISYSSGSFCITGTDPNPTLVGTPGGTYSSSPAGLIIDSNTGVITLATSTLGVYNIVYLTSGTCATSDTFQVTITQNPVTADFNFGVANAFCLNASNPSPIFSGTGIPGIFTSTPAGLVFVDSTTGEIDVINSLPGTYEIVNSVPATSGCAATSYMDTVVLNSAPLAAFTGLDTVYCQNQDTITLIPSTPGGTFYGQGVTGDSFVPNGLPAGTYNISYTLLDANKCYDSTAQSVTILPLPSITLSTNNLAICEGEADTIIASGNAVNYSWYLSGILQETNDTIIIPSSLTAGNYTYIVHGESSNGCVDTTVAASVIVSGAFDPTFSGLNGPYCTNNAPITLTPISPGGVFSGPGISGNTFDPSTTGGIGTVQIQYTIGTGNCQDSSVQNVVIRSVVNISASSTGLNICEGTADSLIASGNASTYVWLYNNNPLGNNDTLIIPTLLTQGTYQIDLIGSSPGSCSDTINITVTIDSIPTVSITSSVNDTICQGESVTLSASATGGTFNWSNGSSSNNITVSPGTTTNYSVVATGLNGCTDTALTTVNVRTKLIVNIYAGTNPNFCEGDIDTLIATGNTSNIEWYQGTTFVSTNDTLIISGLSPGSYQYTLYSTANGSCSDTATYTLTINSKPAITVSSNPTNATICEGESIQLTAQATGGTFSWNTGELTNTINVNPNTSSTYNVVATGLNGCKDTAQYAVTVNPAPDSAYVTSGATSSVCEYGNVILTASSLNASTINVYQGSTLIGNYPNPASVSVSPTSQSTYYFEALSSNSCAQTNDLDSVIVSVNPLPDTASSTFTNPEICFGQTTTIDLLSGTGNPYQYDIWGLPVGGVAPIGEVDVTQFSPNGTTTYYISFEDTVTGCIAIARKPVTITVNPVPLAPSVNLSDNSICVGNSINLTANGSGTGAVYNFYDASSGGTLIGSTDGVTPVTITPPAAGTYHIYVEAVSAQNCAQTTPRTDSVYVVNPNPTVSGANITDATCEEANGSITGVSSTFNINYVWTNLSNQVVGNNSDLSNVVPGVYSLSITEISTGCTNNYVYTVNNISNVYAGFTANDTVFTVGSSAAGVIFTNNSIGANNYSWDFDNGNTSTAENPDTINYYAAGVYEVILTAQGSGSCIDYDTLYIRIIDSLYTWYPNIFTPNGDTKNDVFYIKSTQIADVVVNIFNRWGILIYSYNGVGGFWDGRTSSGSEASDGDYYFMLEGTYKDGTPIEDKNRTGFIRLIR